jgi:hypothetical protein
MSQGSAFDGCDLVTIGGLNSGPTNEWIKIIPGATFANNKSLTSVDLTYVEEFGQGAFSGCSSLENVTFPDLAKYGANAFKGCALFLKDGLPPSSNVPIATSFADQKPIAHISFEEGRDEVTVRKDDPVTPPAFAIKDVKGGVYNDLFDSYGVVKPEHVSWLSGAAHPAELETSPSSLNISGEIGTHVVTYVVKHAPADKESFEFTVHVTSALNVDTPPSARGIVYGSPLSSAVLSGIVKDENGVAVAGAWEWETPNAVPAAGAASFDAKFVPATPGSYHGEVVASIPVNVAKADPDVSVPAVSSIVSGQKLSDATLGAFTQRGVGGVALNGAWRFVQPEDTVFTEGEYDVAVEYDPANVNYNNVSGIVRLIVTSRSNDGGNNPDLKNPNPGDNIAKIWKVTAIAGKGGKITASGSYQAGADVVYTFTPSKGYKVKSVTVNGRKIAIPKSNKYTFKNISADQTIVVAFTLKTFKISITKSGKGTVTKSKAVKYGRNFTLKFKASRGYEISRILVDGKKIKIKKSYTFKNVKKAHRVKVYFKKKR